MAKFEQFDNGDWGINLTDENGNGVPMQVSDMPALMQGLKDLAECNVPSIEGN